MTAAESLRSIVKSSFDLVGLRVSRRAAHAPHPLVRLAVDLLLDVGANTGQFARQAREHGYRGRIVSFEPLAEAHDALRKRAAGDPLWSAHERCAIGAAGGEVEINVAGNSVSSSVLPMLESHARTAPGSAYVGTQRVPLVTLDSVIDRYRQPRDRVFLKIDAQGYESDVLAGAKHALPLIDGVQLELSAVPLYAGQELYPHFFDFFARAGFVLWTLSPGFFDAGSGRMMQFDAVFVREALARDVSGT